MKKLFSLIMTGIIGVAGVALYGCSGSPDQHGIHVEDPTFVEMQETQGYEQDSQDDILLSQEEVPYVENLDFGESVINVGNKVRLAEKLIQAETSGSFTVAYIGGSITQGSSAGSQDCYARLVTDWFEAELPAADINYINAGIGATGSYIGVHRVYEDVLAHKPDIVFVEFSVNDTSEHVQRNKDSYDSLLRRIWNSSSSPAIVTIAMTQEDGTSFQQQHAEIISAYDLPMISYRNYVLALIESSEMIWTDISDDNIHPNKAGHKLLSEMIINYLEEVNFNKNNINGAESDFSISFTDDKYKNANLIRPGYSLDSGAFDAADGSFGGFDGFWRATYDSDDSDNAVFAPLVLEVEAQSIAIFFGKLRRNAGDMEVFINGESVKVIKTDFSGGWGDYVEVVEVVSFEEIGYHLVEIYPVIPDDGERRNYIISSIAIS